jgi:hypothetical protein
MLWLYERDPRSTRGGAYALCASLSKNWMKEGSSDFRKAASAPRCKQRAFTPAVAHSLNTITMPCGQALLSLRSRVRRADAGLDAPGRAPAAPDQRAAAAAAANLIFCFRAKEKIKLERKAGGKTEPKELGWQAIAGEEFATR